MCLCRFRCNILEVVVNSIFKMEIKVPFYGFKMEIKVPLFMGSFILFIKVPLFLPSMFS